MTTPASADCTPVTRETPSRRLDMGLVTCTDKASFPIIGVDPGRRSVLVVNTDATNSVWLIPNEQGTTDSGFELLAGAGITLTTAAKLYGVTKPGVLVAVKYLSETGSV